MRYLIICIVFALTLVGVSSCKKECHDKSNPDCENYDPCYGKSKLTADFEIFESFQYRSSWVPYDTDSLYSIDAVFRAKEEGVIYEWKIGSETITTRTVSRKNFPSGGTIPITLTVKRISGYDCFPTDSTAIKTRLMHILTDDHDQLRVNGCFKGYNTDNPDDVFTVCIKLVDSISYPGEPVAKSTISGLINVSTCPNKTFKVTDREDFGYQQYTFATGQGECLIPWGRVRVDSAFSGDIRIDYSYYKVITDLNSRVDKSFLGKRIQ